MKSCNTPIDARNPALEWYRFIGGQMLATTNLWQSAWDAYLQNLSRAGVKVGCAPCEIPETQCEPSCVCELEWVTCRDEKVTGTIEVRNTGKTASPFTLHADTFQTGCSDAGVKPELAPAMFTLAPGASQLVTVSVTPGASFTPNEVHESRITIAGRYEQCARLRIKTVPQQHPRCVVDHGEIPRRIRAHRWYDHFQCEDLCFEPVTRDRVPTHPDSHR